MKQDEPAGLYPGNFCISHLIVLLKTRIPKKKVEKMVLSSLIVGANLVKYNFSLRNNKLLKSYGVTEEVWEPEAWAVSSLPCCLVAQ